jgi:hypothetical protein
MANKEIQKLDWEYVDEEEEDSSSIGKTIAYILAALGSAAASLITLGFFDKNEKDDR